VTSHADRVPLVMDRTCLLLDSFTRHSGSGAYGQVPVYHAVIASRPTDDFIVLVRAPKSPIN